eukprot:TRINITY_DN493_c0_g1_i1.p1 TRINITY_DN493_c0_g1~~TRINITY_DN493_c0_g1_i1.p1  ORF type:complete len:167 (+),score=36.82 TRINITY_DN493_c0_g1_i1:102-602(+)
MSSAHVYLRLPKGESIESIPESVLEECLQIVKHNSIQGSKTANVNIVYTPWSNLKKTGDMDVGQVGFHRQKDVKLVKAIKKDAEVLNAINKTKREEFPDLAAEKDSRNLEQINDNKATIIERRKKEKHEKEEHIRQKELREYAALMKPSKMKSNQESNEDLEEDFM